VLKEVFRGKFLDEVMRLFRAGKLRLTGELAALRSEAVLSAPVLVGVIKLLCMRMLTVVVSLGNATNHQFAAKLTNPTCLDLFEP
jgi:hypothetical protein